MDDEPLLHNVNPLWLLLFWLPTFAWLFYSGIIAVYLLGTEGVSTTEFWEVIGLTVPTVCLLRVPFLMDRPPSRRFAVVDLTLPILGVVGCAAVAEGSFFPCGFMIVLYVVAFMFTSRAYLNAAN